MKSLYNANDTVEIQRRLAALTGDRQALWGKMNVGQMMAHCVVALEAATGEREIPHRLIGRLLGRLVKPLALGNDKPLKRNSPTAPEFVIAGDRNFEDERARLAALIDRFATAGPAGCTTRPHAFFGPMTPEEWAILNYKHLDHHLRQFNA
jgi:hypothetical protein